MNRVFGYGHRKRSDLMVNTQTMPNLKLEGGMVQLVVEYVDIDQRFAFEEAAGEKWAIASKQVVDQIKIAGNKLSCYVSNVIGDIAVACNCCSVRNFAEQVNRRVNGIRQKLLIRKATAYNIAIAATQNL